LLDPLSIPQRLFSRKGLLIAVATTLIKQFSQTNRKQILYPFKQ